MTDFRLILTITLTPNTRNKDFWLLKYKLKKHKIQVEELLNEFTKETIIRLRML